MSKLQEMQKEKNFCNTSLLDVLQFIDKNVFKDRLDSCPACFYDTASLLKNLKGQPAVLF